MPINTNGPNIVAEYQVSGMPFVTASGNTGRILFPFVTQWLRLKSVTGATTFAFTEGGLNEGNKFTLAAGTTEQFHWKLKEIWISGSAYELVAGLTTVSTDKMWNYVHPPASGSQNATSSIPSTYNTFGYTGI